jgi:hypothetical protein
MPETTREKVLSEPEKFIFPVEMEMEAKRGFLCANFEGI